jgi:hypothetical protein
MMHGTRLSATAGGERQRGLRWAIRPDGLREWGDARAKEGSTRGIGGLPAKGPSGGDGLTSWKGGGWRANEAVETRDLRQTVAAGLNQENRKGKGFLFFPKGFKQLNSNINLNSTKQK